MLFRKISFVLLFVASTAQAQEIPVKTVASPFSALSDPADDSQTGTSNSESALSLQNKSVYVYNFLDIRADQYTVKVLDEFERQLTAWLATRAKSSTIIRSESTPFRTSNVGKIKSALLTKDTSSKSTEMVPVYAIVASNIPAEKDLGAEYRLIVFPDNYEVYGAWRYYTIRWVVMRVSDGKTWEYSYSGKHMLLLKDSERAESRSRKFIAAIDAAMLKAGLFTD